MKVRFQIERHNLKHEVSVSEFTVELEPTDRVLDGLIEIARLHDHTLTFRRSCAHGVCGSDAMRINGKERLACKTLIQDVVEQGHKEGDEVGPIVVQPLRNLTVQRDLMVDHTDFFRKYRSVQPYLKPAKAPEGKEYVQTQENRALIDDATKCINCSACYSACPILAKNMGFLGPAAIVQAARVVFDSRDEGLAPRLDVLDHVDGVWACENHFECTRVCPREIKVTKLINLTKKTNQSISARAGRADCRTE